MKVNMFTSGETVETALTKGERTRQRILEAALALFVEEGYEGATLRGIAARAGCSPALAYRYFSRKEDLVLALYDRLAGELAAEVAGLPRGRVGERFSAAMRSHLGRLAPYRRVLGALFGVATDPKSGVGCFGAGTRGVRGQMQAAFVGVVTGARDAPREPHAGRLAVLLYGAHMGIVLFWLLDRTPEQRATGTILRVAGELLTWARPLLVLPPLAGMLARLTVAIEAVLGGVELPDGEGGSEG
jgi:AcrR family transcriptional regulator